MRGLFLHLAKFFSSLFGAPNLRLDLVLRPNSRCVFQKNGWRGIVLSSHQGFQACVTHASISEQISFGIAQFRNKQWVGVFMRPEGFQRHMPWDIELLVPPRELWRVVVLPSLNLL